MTNLPLPGGIPDSIAPPSASAPASIQPRPACTRSIAPALGEGEETPLPMRASREKNCSSTPKLDRRRRWSMSACWRYEAGGRLTSLRAYSASGWRRIHPPSTPTTEPHHGQRGTTLRQTGIAAPNVRAGIWDQAQCSRAPMERQMQRSRAAANGIPADPSTPCAERVSSRFIHSLVALHQRVHPVRHRCGSRRGPPRLQPAGIPPLAQHLRPR